MSEMSDVARKLLKPERVQAKERAKYLSKRFVSRRKRVQKIIFIGDCEILKKHGNLIN
jgi:hypothetical protein